MLLLASTAIMVLDECQRSRYADDMVELKYAPDLVVQGIITVGLSHRQPLRGVVVRAADSSHHICCLTDRHSFLLTGPTRGRI